MFRDFALEAGNGGFQVKAIRPLDQFVNAMACLGVKCGLYCPQLLQDGIVAAQAGARRFLGWKLGAGENGGGCHGRVSRSSSGVASKGEVKFSCSMCFCNRYLAAGDTM